MSNIKFKIKVVQFVKFTANFQIKPLQTTKRSYYVTNNPFSGCFHKYKLLVTSSVYSVENL